MDEVTIFNPDGSVKPTEQYLKERWDFIRKTLSDHQWNLLDLKNPVVATRLNEIFELSGAREIIERHQLMSPL